MASPGNQHCASCIGTLSFPLYRLSHSVCHFPRICQIWRTHKNPTMPQKRRSTFLIDWLYLCTYVDLGERFETNVVDDIPATHSATTEPITELHYMCPEQNATPLRRVVGACETELHAKHQAIFAQNLGSCHFLSNLTVTKKHCIQDTEVLR